VENSVVGSLTLAEALAEHPRYFSKLELALIKTGETAGRLDEVFKNLADWFDFRLELQRTFLNKLMYPLFLIHFAALIMPFPAFFQGGNAIQYALSSALILAPFYIIGIVFFLILPLARQTLPPFAALTDRLILYIPFIRGVVIKLEMLRFATTFRMSTMAGVGLMETVNLAADVCVNSSIQSKIRGLCECVDRGEPLSRGMQRSGLFPRMVVQMFETGEKGGKLDEITAKITEYYTEEVKTSLGRLVKVLNFVIYLGIMLFIAWSIIRSYAGHFAEIEKLYDGEL
jgi:type II secretory pathway component PulF